MTKGEVAHDLQEYAQGHRRDAESVVTDCAHRHQPGDDDGDKGCICQVGIDALHRSEPEETDEEE